MVPTANGNGLPSTRTAAGAPASSPGGGPPPSLPGRKPWRNRSAPPSTLGLTSENVKTSGSRGGEESEAGAEARTAAHSR